jgi:hypothetical protein
MEIEKKIYPRYKDHGGITIINTNLETEQELIEAVEEMENTPKPYKIGALLGWILKMDNLYCQVKGRKELEQRLLAIYPGLED